MSEKPSDSAVNWRDHSTIDPSKLDRRPGDSKFHNIQKRIRESYQEGSPKGEDSYTMRQMYFFSIAREQSYMFAGDFTHRLDNINPVWMDFPVRCVRKLSTVEEMQNKIDLSTHSDEVMIVRYFRENCVACAALDKCFEYMCHESRSKYPKLSFYEVSATESPRLVKGMVRFPQVKSFAGGRWETVNFKPGQQYRERLLRELEESLMEQQETGTSVSAGDAEEMYFSAAGPAMLRVLRKSIIHKYAQEQARLHNYFKQVSIRRTWFYKKFVEPHVDPDVSEAAQTTSILGEKIEYGPQLPPSDL